MNQALDAALNRLTKWRSVFCGWQLGTRSSTDPEAQAVRDHREATMLLRAEGSALVNLLIKKGVFSYDEWCAQLLVEAEELDRSYETLFPGFRSSDAGMVMDPAQAAQTTKGWRP